MSSMTLEMISKNKAMQFLLSEGYTDELSYWKSMSSLSNGTIIDHSDNALSSLGYTGTQCDKLIAWLKSESGITGTKYDMLSKIVGGISSATFLTSGTTWTVPEDWNNDSNTIEAIGAGGNGAAGVNNTSSGGGGGGGEYRKISNQVLTPGSVVNISIAAGGSEADTYLQNNLNASVIIAKAGLNAVNATGGAGGTGGTGAGGNYDGGAGGNGRVAAGNVGAAGGGGSAGKIGAGKAAGNNTASAGATGGGGSNGGSSTASANVGANTGSPGGAGTSGAGGGLQGVSGVSNGANGSNGGGGGGGSSGTNSRVGGNGGVDNTFGGGKGASGGGGGSAAGAFVNGGNGGTYGGGGGGGCSQAASHGDGGTGGQGLIVINYTPAVPLTLLTVQKFFTSSQTTAIRIRPQEQTRNYVIVRNLEATNVVQIAFVSSANNFVTPPTTGFTDLNPDEEWYETGSTNQIWIRSKVDATDCTVEIETSVPRA